jgi:hypothetical protein
MWSRASFIVLALGLLLASSACRPATPEPSTIPTAALASTAESGVDRDPTDEPASSPAPGTTPTSTLHHFGGARLEVEAPFSTATVKIEPDGTVRYEASSPETGIEEETGAKEVGDEGISRLMEAVRDAAFFSLEASYPYQSGVSYEDGSTYSIQVHVGGETKEVTCYESECPTRFERVMDAIREIWGEEILEVGV